MHISIYPLHFHPQTHTTKARPPADAFVGYGGVVVREAVAKGADWYVHSFEELINVVAKK